MNIHAATRRKIYVSVSLCAMLMNILVLLLGGCGIQAQAEATPPNLLGVVRVPGPSDIAIAPNGWAYVISEGGSRGSPAIFVLDGPDVISEIPWPIETISARLADIVVHPLTGLAYIIDQWGQSLIVIDGLDIVSVMKIGYDPEGLVVHPESGLVYIVNRRTAPVEKEEEPGPGEVIIVQDSTIARRIPLELPHVITFSEFDRRVYVGQSNPFGDGAQNVLVAIDDSTMVTETVYAADDLGSVYQIAINENSGEMYLTRGDYGLITYWDGTEFQLIDLKSPGYSINEIAVDSQRNWLYAASWDGSPSHVVVIEKDKIIAEIPTGTDVRDVAVDETHNFVYAANYRSNTLSIIRETELITTVETGGLGPWQIEIDEDRSYVYVTNSNSASIAVFGYEETPPTFWQQYFPFLVR